MINKHISRLLLAIGVILPMVATGGQINNAKITTITNDSNGIVRITLTGGTEISPKADCTMSSNGRDFVYDINEISGNGWHSMALTALAAAKLVNVVGKNVCLALRENNPYESVDMMYIVQ